jgi:hypothetical protein
MQSVVNRTTEAAQLRAAAYHEAGHAVVAIFLGYKVAKINIACDSERRGYTEHTCHESSQALVIVSLAGVICLEQFNVPSDEVGGSLQDTVDYMNALDDLLPEADDHEKKQLFNRLRSETSNILQKPMVGIAISALARRLLVDRTMVGEEVHAIVESFLAREEA